jgi:hypothetical protein
VRLVGCACGDRRGVKRCNWDAPERIRAGFGLGTRLGQGSCVLGATSSPPWSEKIFNAESYQEAKGRVTDLLEPLAEIAPKVCGLLQGAEEDLLGLYGLRAEHLTKARSTNRWRASTRRSAGAPTSSGSSPTTRR